MYKALFIDLAEIKRLRIMCNACHGVVDLPLGRQFRSCPACSEELFPDDSTEYAMLLALEDVLKQSERTDLKARFQLELRVQD